MIHTIGTEISSNCRTNLVLLVLLVLPLVLLLVPVLLLVLLQSELHAPELTSRVPFTQSPHDVALRLHDADTPDANSTTSTAASVNDMSQIQNAPQQYLSGIFRKFI